MSAIPGAPAKLRAFLATLGESNRTDSSSNHPPWFQPGVTCEIEEQIYGYFLRIAVPKVGESDWFVVGRELGPFRLFWRYDEKYFGRELTGEEVHRFGELTERSLIRWQQHPTRVSEIDDVRA